MATKATPFCSKFDVQSVVLSMRQKVVQKYINMSSQETLSN